MVAANSAATTGFLQELDMGAPSIELSPCARSNANHVRSNAETISLPPKPPSTTVAAGAQHDGWHGAQRGGQSAGSWVRFMDFDSWARFMGSIQNNSALSQGLAGRSSGCLSGLSS